MAYDLVIRGGTVIDGTGLAGFRADVAVTGGRIAEVGRVRERGKQEIDAGGMVVTPGFVDGHTHMDAQVFWDPLGTCSCWHGVTTVVMGNCGFTLAPARPDRRDLVIANLERAEDISPAAMAAGIQWTWDTFRSYLDAVDRLPKGINYAANIGHSALRTWVMGERAWDGPATGDDVVAMERELADALDAGAIGFTTSRGFHETPDGRPVASRVADWSEIERLVGVLGDKGAGLFELAGTAPGESPQDQRDRLRDLAVESGVPVTFGLFAHRGDNSWRDQLAMLDDTAASGGRMFGQSHSRDISNVLSFRTQLPFDRLAEWQPIRALPPAEQQAALADPAVRARLVEAAHHGTYPKAIGGEARRPTYERLFVVRSALPGSNPSVAAVASERGVDPVEAMIELALETDFDQFFLQPNVNLDLDAVLEILRHPRTVMTFSDSGAHVSQIMDSSIQTVLLAYWVREREAFTLEEAVRMITSVPATSWGFSDRGILRTGLVADLNVFDPDRIMPELPTVANDLPAGAVRLVQKTSGIRATVVAGQVLVADGEHTGALPGQLLEAVPSPAPGAEVDEERATWLARTSEPAIEADLPIVDSHHHLWDHDGDRYFLDELLADTGSGHNVVQTVYVECGEAYDTDVPAELAPLGETRWASVQAADSERRPGAVIAAVVGYADLRLGPDAVRRSLEAQVEAAGGRFVGIRHATAWDESPQVFDHRTHPTRELLRDETFRRSFAVLGEMGLTFDAFCYHPQVPEVVDLARAFPDTTVVLDHLGSPVGVGPYAGRRDEVLSWLDGQLAELASCPNAHLKLGGMGMPWFGGGWHRLARPPGSEEVAESWGPFVRRCIEHFGPDRCMFESNFPVDRRSFPYVVAVNAFMRMTADLSGDERADVFAGTARRVYGIPTVSPS